MKAQRRAGLAFSWPWVAAAFLIGIAWNAAALATIAMDPTYRGIRDPSALAGWAWD